MSADDRACPKARGGLLASDHSKRGRRFVTLVDPETLQVSLLEPWEHAILVLCDGSRTVPEITDILPDAIEGQAIDDEVVTRCLKFFERENLIHEAGLRMSEDRPAGPRTMAELQAAYQEWHKDPVKTGEWSAWSSPSFPGITPPFSPDLGPTMAMPREDDRPPAPVGIGSTLVVAQAESVLIDSSPGGAAITPRRHTDAQARAVLEALDVGVPEAPMDPSEISDVLDVLQAVDRAVSEADALEHDDAPPPPAVIDEMLKNVGVNADAALNPTMVGQPARASERMTMRRDRTAETVGVVPVYDEQTSRLNYPPAQEEMLATEQRPVLEAQPLEPADEGREGRTDHGVLVDGRPSSDPARARTMSTGARPDPDRARELFESLASAIGAADRKVGRRNGATIEEVRGHLADRDSAALTAHYRKLAARLAGSRATMAMLRAFEGAGPRGRRAGVLRGFRNSIGDAVSAGRCPACLARNTSGFDRCSDCGYLPPRRRRSS